MLHDPLSDALSTIKNAEKAGKSEIKVRHATRILRDVLRIMQKYGYIGNFEHVEDGRGGLFRIELKGRINDCHSVKPRFPVKKDEYAAWEKRFLPAGGVGILIISTSQGIVCHREIKGRLGGTLVAYVY